MSMERSSTRAASCEPRLGRSIWVGMVLPEPHPSIRLPERPVPSTNTLNLLPGSITSVSAVDPGTGQGLIIPYGSNSTGSAWIDPAGTNITSGGVPGKTITLGGSQIVDSAGSVLDLSGGGNLASYQFVSGDHGSLDILNSGAGVPWSNATQYSAGQVVTYKGSTWVALQAGTGRTPAANLFWVANPDELRRDSGVPGGVGALRVPFNTLAANSMRPALPKSEIRVTSAPTCRWANRSISVEGAGCRRVSIRCFPRAMRCSRARIS